MVTHVAQAAMEYIEDGMTIGLGSGEAIVDLLEFISMKDFSRLTIVTNRMDTALLASQRHLNVTPCWMVDKLNYAFDTLDYVATDLSGLKQDDLVVLDDKLLASMADTFVEMIRKDHFAVVEAPGIPVEVEVIKPAFSFVRHKLGEMTKDVRALNASGQPMVSSNGNYVIEALFENSGNLKALDAAITAIPGVISTSIYTGTKAIALLYDDETVKTVQL